MLVNGHLLDLFCPSRGVRQGCPLSLLLCVISIEVLAANILAHPEITGLRLRNVRESLYVDDTSVIATSDNAVRVFFFGVYSLFEKGTGSRLNLSKCRGLSCDSLHFRTDTPVAIQWTSDKIKILSVFLGHGHLSANNWQYHLEAAERCLDSWRSRAPSYSGKALVVNTLALSKIWYVASLVVMPASVSFALNHMVFNLFWSGKGDLVARNVVSMPRDTGGFSIVSIELKVFSLLALRIRRLVLHPCGWVSALAFWLFDRFETVGDDVLSHASDFSLSQLPFYFLF